MNGGRGGTAILDVTESGLEIEHGSGTVWVAISEKKPVQRHASTLVQRPKKR